MNVYLAFSIGLLLGLLVAGASTLCAVRWAVSKFLADAYHKDLLPEIMRAEGLLNVGLIESNMNYVRMYMEMARDAVRRHKENIQESLKKWHKWT